MPLDLGVQGYVLKDSALAEIVIASGPLATGHNFVSPMLSTYLFGRRRRAQALSKEQPSRRLEFPRSMNAGLIGQCQAKTCVPASHTAASF